MAKRELAGVAVLLLAASLTARAKDLEVGDEAPKISVKEFVKGEPVKEFEKGKIYVVEFWGTWCGPCKECIPHLTELQRKYKDVTIIGVSVAEPDPSKVKSFVEKMGEKMDYRVAVDGGGMLLSWLLPGLQGGFAVPVAYIIDGEGKIAWIVDPTEMDKPLAKICSGKKQS